MSSNVVWIDSRVALISGERIRQFINCNLLMWSVFMQRFIITTIITVNF